MTDTATDDARAGHRLPEPGEAPSPGQPVSDSLEARVVAFGTWREGGSTYAVAPLLATTPAYGHHPYVVWYAAFKDDVPGEPYVTAYNGAFCSTLDEALEIFRAREQRLDR